MGLIASCLLSMIPVRRVCLVMSKRSPPHQHQPNLSCILNNHRFSSACRNIPPSNFPLSVSTVWTVHAHNGLLTWLQRTSITSYEVIISCRLQNRTPHMPTMFWQMKARYQIKRPCNKSKSYCHHDWGALLDRFSETVPYSLIPWKGEFKCQ